MTADEFKAQGIVLGHVKHPIVEYSIVGTSLKLRQADVPGSRGALTKQGDDLRGEGVGGIAVCEQRL